MAKLALALCLLGAAVLPARGTAVSPVQKVIELLDTCKAKIVKDLDAETKAMEEYNAFCDKELEEKGYAIKTATRDLGELDADIKDNEAIGSEMDAIISETGSLIAEKDKELASVSSEREAKNGVFVAAEKEMVESIDELTRAADVLKQGAAGGAFLQASALPKKVRSVISALKTIVDAQHLDMAGRKRLRSFLQASQRAKEDSEDLQFAPQGKVQAIESHSGSIVETVEDMQKKAEDSLSELRQKEMSDVHGFEMVKQNLESEMGNLKEKLDTSTKRKAESVEKLSSAKADSVETEKSKEADEEYSASLKTECEQTAVAWEERQKSAKEEMGAIEKAKEILVSGVKVLMQVKSSTSRTHRNDDDDGDVVSPEDAAREKVITLIRGLARQHKSFALAQIASATASDPFVKIRGLIDDMIAKLVKEAQEEATHEAFCQEEMGKSKASKEDKETKLEKHTSRIEEAEAKIAELDKKVKTLESEIAAIDDSQTEATKIRAEENAEYKINQADFSQSAEAVARAIEVLKGYYEGAFLVQVKSHTTRNQAPSFGSAKGDAGSSIISILEMSQEDFTTLLAETEETEAKAAEDYEKLTNENKVSRAAKEAEAKASASESKSLKVNLENYKEDQAAVSEELDAVLAYIDKLKPECESKAMSYEEKKAAREAEIAGLKEALEILSGQGMALAQTGRSLRVARRV